MIAPYYASGNLLRFERIAVQTDQEIAGVFSLRFERIAVQTDQEIAGVFSYLPSSSA
jgi:hypothetical protein